MRTCTALAACIAWLVLDLSPAWGASAVFGHWLTDDRAAVIRIERCGAKLCGRIERVLDPRAPARDINNPEPALREQPLVGTLVLSDFTPSATGWRDGRAYDPKAGKSYRSEIKLLGNGKLKVTGCVMIVCRSRYWTRIR